jgi:hypothetical protein
MRSEDHSLLVAALLLTLTAGAPARGAVLIRPAGRPEWSVSKATLEAFAPWLRRRRVSFSMARRFQIDGRGGANENIAWRVPVRGVQFIAHRMGRSHFSHNGGDGGQRLAA